MLGLCLATADAAAFRLGFNPASLFTGGVQGGLYDPSDLTTMYQTGTRAAPGTAVANDGDPVGLILDKSGNNFDLAQATAGKRPLYKTSGGLRWLQFDGVDDVLSINAAGLRITGDLTLSAAAYKNGGSTYGGILGCQTNAATINAYEWRFSNHATVLQPELVNADGTSVVNDMGASPALGVFATPTVASMRRSSGVNVEHSINKARQTTAQTLVPTSDASSVFTIGDRSAGGIPLAGRIYAAAAITGRLSDANLAQLESWLGAKAGLTI